MIRLLSHHLQQLHYQRQYWLTRAERRRAIIFMSLLTVLVTISILLWLLY
jgi:hypothetical protein